MYPQVENICSTFAKEHQLLSHHVLQLCLAPAPKENPFLQSYPYLAWFCSQQSTWNDTHSQRDGASKDKTPIQFRFTLSARLECSCQDREPKEVIISFFNHLTNFPEAITKGRWIETGELELHHDIIKAFLDNFVIEVEWACIGLLVIFYWQSKITLAPPRASWHSESYTNIVMELSFSQRGGCCLARADDVFSTTRSW